MQLFSASFSRLSAYQALRQAQADGVSPVSFTGVLRFIGHS